ncbi:hypothetical protein [Streptomyces sp. NPDC001089]
MATELTPLERLMAQDQNKPAAVRFAERMRQVRIANGRQAADEEPEEEVPGTVVGRLSPPLVARLAAALEGADDLEADMIRIAFGIPLADETPVGAGQGKGGDVHFTADSLSTRTTGSCPGRA